MCGHMPNSRRNSQRVQRVVLMDLNIVVRDVRCFAGRHSIPVRPLTILLGENSTGKSTFLALAAAIFDGSNFPLRLDLNAPPYDLGNFDNIITASRRGTD